MRFILALFIIYAGLWAGDEVAETVTSAPVDLNKTVEMRQAGVPCVRNAATGVGLVARTRLEYRSEYRVEGNVSGLSVVNIPLWLVRPLKPADVARLNKDQQAAVQRLAEATDKWADLQSKFAAARARVEAAKQSQATTERQIDAIVAAATKAKRPLRASDHTSFSARREAARRAVSEAAEAESTLRDVESGELTRLGNELAVVWNKIQADLGLRGMEYYTTIEERNDEAHRAAMRQPIPMPAEAKK